jgi:hypothetical protein
MVSTTIPENHMLRVHPFEALRPAGSRAALVSCPAAIAGSGGATGVACGCCDPATDSYRAVLEATSDDEARQTIERLLAHGALVPDPEPRIYVYRITRDGQRQVGIVATIERASLDAAIDPIEAPTWAEPATAVFDDPAGAVLGIACEDMNERPIFHFNAGDGTTHSGWLARDPARYIEAFATLTTRATLVRPGACSGCDRMLALLLDRGTALDPLPAPRCGLFVQRTALLV